MNAADDVIATLSSRVTELSKRVAMLQAELESATKRLAIYEEHDATIQDALSSALRAAYQIRERAEVAGGQILEQSREERRMLLTEIERLRDERDGLQEDIATARRSSMAAVSRSLTSEAATEEIRAVATDALKGLFQEIVADIRGTRAYVAPPMPEAPRHEEPAVEPERLLETEEAATPPTRVIEVEETPTYEAMANLKGHPTLTEEEEIAAPTADELAAAEKAAEEQAAAELRASEERANTIRAEAERVADELAAKERAKAEARAAEERAAEQRAAEERAKAEARAAEERAAEERIEAERAAAERAAAETRAAQARAEADRAAMERAAAEQAAAESRAAAERAAQERAAQERAAAEARVATERAAAERAVAERAAQQRAAQERAAADARAARERDEAERAARVEQERSAAEARAAQERAAAQRAARVEQERAAAQRAADLAVATAPARPPLELVPPRIETGEISPARVEAASPTSDIQLVLSPIGSFPRLVEIERHIQALPAVRTLYVRDFRGGVATLAVTLRSSMTPEEFAGILAGLQQPRVRLIAGSRNRLELRIEGEASIA